MTLNAREREPVVIVGAGFTGLAAAYELSKNGIPVTVLEQEAEIGGLARAFNINGQKVEQFYHHWFNNDVHVIDLINELGLGDHLEYSPTRTGVYMSNNFYHLSTPLDVLRFKPLPFWDRIRLGLLVVKARRVKDWKPLESITAQEWLMDLCGPNVYRVVWEPLLRGKFGPVASEVSAVWFWNKLVLRGGSRNKVGAETLVYYRDSFSSLAAELEKTIESAGGQILTDTPAEGLTIQNGRVTGISTPNGPISASAVIATTAPEIVAGLIPTGVNDEYVKQLRKIRYLANLCLVLELKHSLSDIYWLNINDPDFPFIGVIEHTNFQNMDTCGNRHIIYLSKYLPETSELYLMSEEDIFEFAFSHIQRMFPDFDRSWVYRYHVWKARWAQPVTVCHYSRMIPSQEAPIGGLYLANMAQIYPQDRGTNYAVQQGRHIGQVVM